MAEILIDGDKAITINFGNQINLQIYHQVLSLYNYIRELDLSGVTETVPSYTSLTVYYNPIILSYRELVNTINNFLPKCSHNTFVPAQRNFVIPVLYGRTQGPDLDKVSSLAGLSTEETIKLHTKDTYLIFMLGFLPGFPYMGILPEKLRMLRLAQPRTEIKPGSVGIAGAQTGIYPIASPGGWQIIGHTPIKIFDIKRPDPFLFRPGDTVKFQSIKEEEYDLLNRQVSENAFCYEDLIREVL